MRLRSLVLGFGAALLASSAHAADVPVVMNPFHSDQGFMFDWIFFAIMIPIPAWLYWDMARNR